MKFLGQGFRQLEHEQDRHTDRQTDRQTHRLTDATESSSIRFAGGNNHIHCVLVALSCNLHPPVRIEFYEDNVA